uniref:Uncharacterized protein n=1 Tax=Cacopsylla melanoneura TaxID=428564 RepID=A0A8D8WB39_9HEMI
MTLDKKSFKFFQLLCTYLLENIEISKISEIFEYLRSSWDLTSCLSSGVSHLITYPTLNLICLSTAINLLRKPQNFFCCSKEFFLIHFREKFITVAKRKNKDFVFRYTSILDFRY